MYTKEELVEIENEIAECFNNAEIKAPVHLYDSNEEQIIEIFKKQIDIIKKNNFCVYDMRNLYTFSKMISKGIKYFQI